MLKISLPRYRLTRISIKASGFTLIEVLVVMTIMITVATFGFVGVRDFAIRQSVIDSKLDFTSLLKLARSRAQTQVKPIDCTTPTNRTLNGYKVVLSCARTTCAVNTYNTMALIPVCGGTDAATVSTKNLPSDIALSSPTRTFLFRTLSGSLEGVTGESVITIQPRTGQPQTVTVYDDGRIELHEE